MEDEMIVKNVKFIGSYDFVHQCPEPKYPEYAFVGRSNVGKSSLINALTNRKSIARVSKTPGKTQNINYYLVNDSWYLVDLPGYGYAKISKTKREAWQDMIRDYMTKRSSLITVFVLIDSRIDAQKIDIEFMNNLGALKVPFGIIYTKIDKVKKSKRIKSIKNIQNEIRKSWAELPEQFITSSEEKIGLDSVLDYITSLNETL